MDNLKLDLENYIQLACSAFSGKNYWETIPSYDLELNGMYLSDGSHGLRKQIEKPEKLGLKKGYPATVFPS